MVFNQDTSLDFKEHSDFFEKYFELRYKFIEAMSEMTFSNDKAAFSNLYKDLLKLVDWTTVYINNTDIYTDLDKLKTSIITFNRQDTAKAKTLSSNFRNILKLINKDHERHEILPKVRLDAKPDYLTEKEDKIRDALRAYEILNAQ